MKQDVIRRKLPGELFTALGMLFNSLAVTLLIKADFGISPISAVPYVLSAAFPALSLGAWNVLAQCLWLTVTMLALRKVKPGYLFAFLLAFVFGFLLDFWAGIFRPLPAALPWRAACFAFGFLLMACGIACFYVCGTPVLPFDTVPRAFTLEKGISAQKTRLIYDLTNLTLAILFGLVFCGRLVGIGWVTFFNAMTMGYAAGYAVKCLNARFEVTPRIAWLGKLV